MRKHALIACAVAATMLGAATVHAQASRTWVSGVGDDANPCSRTAPCKTFAGAISKTAAGGEIDALDPGGFGAVTITKSITIDGGSAFASILASGTNAVVVNAAPSDRVVLRNLSFNGIVDSAAPGLRGVRFVAGRTLHLDHCVLDGFTMTAIAIEGPTELYANDTTIRRAAGGGIDLAPTSGAVRATLDNVRIEASAFGVRAGPNATAVIRNSGATGNAGDGFLADGNGELTLIDSLAVHNLHGVRATGGGTVRISRDTIVDNTDYGVLAEPGSLVYSFRDNNVAGNENEGRRMKRLSQN